MIKTHTIDGAIIYDGKATIEPRTERYVHIPMPWTKRIYAIREDDEAVRRPVLAIYWYHASPHYFSLIIRMGWHYWNVKKRHSDPAIRETSVSNTT